MRVASSPMVNPPPEEPVGSTTEFVQSVVNAKTLRVWGFKSAVSLVDQGLTSGVGLIINLFLARWLCPANYGAFALAFAVFLFIAGIHNALLLEPLTVIGPSSYRDSVPEYLAAQIKLHAILMGCFSAAAGIGLAVTASFLPRSPLIPSLLGASLALPFLLLAWIMRRVCYVMNNPPVAVMGSTAYFVFAVAGILGLRHWNALTGLSAFILIGVAGVFATFVMAWQLRLLNQRAVLGSSVNWRLALQENWKYGRWLLGSPVLYAAANQVQLFLVAGILGLGSAGVLRAMQLPSLVMAQIVAGTGPLILSGFSHDFGRGAITLLRHKAIISSALLGISSLAFAAVLTVAARPVEKLLFAGKYSEFALLMPLLALIPVANGFAHGLSMALRAAQRPQFDLLANGIAAPIGVVSAAILTPLWKLQGAAVSMVGSFVTIAIVTLICYRKLNRSSFQEQGNREGIA